RGSKVERAQVATGVGDLRAERIVLPGERAKLRVDRVEPDLPVVAIVDRLLEALLVLLVGRIRTGGRLEERARLIDVALVELRSAVRVVELGDAVLLRVLLELDTHEARDHLKVRH